MKITVCIGSSCHLKGSRRVMKGLQDLISQNNLEEKVEIKVDFCSGHCQQGVSVTVDDDIFSVTPESLDKFFQRQVKSRL